MKKQSIQFARLEKMDPDARLTREQAAELCDCAPGTIANHNYAGVLPYAPTRPITVRAGDLKVYAKAIANGMRPKLHLGLRIKAADMPTYSRLDGILRLDTGRPGASIQDVIKLTSKLAARYKKEG